MNPIRLRNKVPATGEASQLAAVQRGGRNDAISSARRDARRKAGIFAKTATALSIAVGTALYPGMAMEAAAAAPQAAPTAIMQSKVCNSPAAYFGMRNIAEVAEASASYYATPSSSYVSYYVADGNSGLPSPSTQFINLNKPWSFQSLSQGSYTITQGGTTMPVDLNGVLTIINDFSGLFPKISGVASNVLDVYVTGIQKQAGFISTHKYITEHLSGTVAGTSCSLDYSATSSSSTINGPVHIGMLIGMVIGAAAGMIFIPLVVIIGAAEVYGRYTDWRVNSYLSDLERWANTKQGPNKLQLSYPYAARIIEEDVAGVVRGMYKLHSMGGWRSGKVRRTVKALKKAHKTGNMSSKMALRLHLIMDAKEWTAYKSEYVPEYVEEYREEESKVAAEARWRDEWERRNSTSLF